MKRARAIAFYLPQYHPIPENDRFWGAGFTEWTNVAKARPLFPGHYQPHVPADLGFYDLRLAEIRLAQARLAAEYGLEGFCYYHYWFAGKRLLERPFKEVLATGEPDFPFCICWANQTWTGVWHGAPDRVLIEQTYPGEQDYVDHFRELLPAFHDPRYIRVNGRPVFVVYRPTELPDSLRFSNLWKRLAREAGLPGLYLAAIKHDEGWDATRFGFDAGVHQKLPPRTGRIPWRYLWTKMKQGLNGNDLTVYFYEEVVKSLLPSVDGKPTDLPCVLPNWDNTPRSGANGLVLHRSTPELFRRHLTDALHRIEKRPPHERLLFIKSWNEWAEGNHLEPDLRYGCDFLQVLSDSLKAGS